MVLSILEIQISTKALEHELSDMEEELGNSNVIVDYLKTTFDKVFGATLVQENTPAIANAVGI